MRLTHDDGRGIQLERLNDFRISKQARVARTFQNIRLFPGMTALENLMVAQHNALMRASGLTLLGLLGVPSWRSAEQKAIDLARTWLVRIGLLDRAVGDAPARDPRLARGLWQDRGAEGRRYRDQPRRDRLADRRQRRRQIDVDDDGVRTAPGPFRPDRIRRPGYHGAADPRDRTA